MGRKTVYTFTVDGRFEAVRYELNALRYEFGKKKVGGHVGTWSVSGARMTLQVTESADDWVETGKPFELAVTDVKSEDGKVFKFTLARTEPVTDSRTLTRLQEHPPWLVGTWLAFEPAEKAADDLRMELRFEADGRFHNSRLVAQ